MASKDHLPEEWTDDDFMRGMMSTFKRREVNPDDYDTKMKFWSQAIQDSCFTLKDPVVSIKTLGNRFRRKNRIPAGLETVMNELISKGAVQRTEDFLRGSQGWLSWGFGVVSRPVSWIFGYNETPEVSESEYVFPVVIKDQAAQVIDVYESSRENADNDTVSNGLQRDQVISIGESRTGEKIVKFRESSGSGPATLTESDASIHNLQNTMEKLQSELLKLDEAAQQLDKDARIQIRQGNKMKAKQILRKKLLVLKKVKEKDTAYSNMLSLMHKLAQTKEQRQILDAYKYGVSAFRSNLDKHGLSPEKVDETMDDIHEALEDHQDIAMALSQGPSIGRNSETDDELENELDDLLKQEEEEVEPTPSKRVRLPDVPTDVHYEEPTKWNHDKTEDRLKRLRMQLNS